MQMLFLHLFRERTKARDYEERAKVFLEVFGNIALRPPTAQLVRQAAEKLRAKVVRQLSSGTVDLTAATEDDEEKVIPNVDLSKLKSRELDVLEKIFSSWKGGNINTLGDCSAREEGQALDLRTFWDFRLRQLLMDRYDVKVGELIKVYHVTTIIYTPQEGIFEMDYQLRLVARGGANISHKEYCEWRRTGNAFPWVVEVTRSGRWYRVGQYPRRELLELRSSQADQRSTTTRKTTTASLASAPTPPWFPP
jgi:hypothetical protein